MSKKINKTATPGVPFNPTIQEVVEALIPKKGGENMDKKANVFKISDVIAGTVDVPTGHAEKGESAALRASASKILHAAGDCMLLSEFVKSFYNRFTRDEYNYARQVFMTRGGIFSIKKARIAGDSRERLFLVRVK